MFGIFKKAEKKAELVIEKGEVTLSKADAALDNINEVACEIKQVMSGIKLLITVSAIGIILGISADVVSMLVNGKTVKIIKK